MLSLFRLLLLTNNKRKGGCNIFYINLGRLHRSDPTELCSGELDLELLDLLPWLDTVLSQNHEVLSNLYSKRSLLKRIRTSPRKQVLFLNGGNDV